MVALHSGSLSQALTVVDEFLCNKKMKKVTGSRYQTGSMDEYCLQWNIRIQFKLWNSLNPGNEVLLLIVDVKVEDVSVGRKSHRFELVQEPL